MGMYDCLASIQDYHRILKTYRHMFVYDCLHFNKTNNKRLWYDADHPRIYHTNRMIVYNESNILIHEIWSYESGDRHCTKHHTKAYTEFNLNLGIR